MEEKKTDDSKYFVEGQCK